MTETLRLTQIADKTGLSLRYWQKRAANGEIPGTTSLKTGRNTIYFVDADSFENWWTKQLKPVKKCRKRKTPKVSSNEVKSGGSGKPSRANYTGTLSKQETWEQLKTAATK